MLKIVLKQYLENLYVMLSKILFSINLVLSYLILYSESTQKYKKKRYCVNAFCP